MYRYNRADLVRILRLTARQLAAWEKAGLVAAAESYSFFDLLQIKKVRDLCARKVRPAVIRQSLEAMQKQVAGMVEPIAGQFMFDFSTQERVVSSSKISIVKPEPASTDVAELFARGIMLEEDPGQHTLAIQTYQRVLELDPNHAAAHINLGTLYYNRQEYTLAEKHYRRAITRRNRPRG